MNLRSEDSLRRLGLLGCSERSEEEGVNDSHGLLPPRLSERDVDDVPDDPKRIDLVVDVVDGDLFEEPLDELRRVESSTNRLDLVGSELDDVGVCHGMATYVLRLFFAVHERVFRDSDKLESVWIDVESRLLMELAMHGTASVFAGETASAHIPVPSFLRWCAQLAEEHRTTCSVDDHHVDCDDDHRCRRKGIYDRVQERTRELMSGVLAIDLRVASHFWYLRVWVSRTQKSTTLWCSCQ